MRFTGAILLALLSTAAYAQDAVQLLHEVANTYTKATSYHFKFSEMQSMQSSLAKSWHRTDYEIAQDGHGKEHFFVNEFGRHLLAISDGTHRWVYAPSRHQYVETSARQITDPRDPVRVLHSAIDQVLVQFRFIDRRFLNPTIERSENLNISDRTVRCVVVKGTLPVPDGVSTSTTKEYWIDPITHLVWKEVMESHDAFINGEVERGSHTSVEITFSAANIGGKLDDGLFAFSVPAGTERVNLLWAMGSAVSSLSGKQAPALKLAAIDGSPFDLNALRGKRVVLDFWASWCAPCRAQMPQLIKLYQEYKDKGFVFVGISEDEDADAAKRFIDLEKIPWLNLQDSDTEAGKLWNVEAVPVLVLIDPDGKIAVWLSGDSPVVIPSLRSALER
jgi:thiol-disulfide isomerase/thioredoxin/outer membrane lipoprotein-sorting protein